MADNKRKHELSSDRVEAPKVRVNTNMQDNQQLTKDAGELRVQVTSETDSAQQSAMLNSILAGVRSLKEISCLKLVDFQVVSPFTVALLSDGSIGSAGNYAVQNHIARYDPADAKQRYYHRIESDPLLLDALRSDASLVGLSLYVAILSALSQSLINEQLLQNLGLRFERVQDQSEVIRRRIQPGDVVSLIGYGGGLDLFCKSDLVKHLYVCDLMFQQRKYKQSAWRKIASISQDIARVTLDDGASSAEIIRSSDVCFITGSALCNGTMERLLSVAQGCREIIVQGPSCSLLPLEFFRRSATMLLTTIKSQFEIDAGAKSGNQIYKVVDMNYVAIWPDMRRRG